MRRQRRRLFAGNWGKKKAFNEGSTPNLRKIRGDSDFEYTIEIPENTAAHFGNSNHTQLRCPVHRTAARFRPPPCRVRFAICDLLLPLYFALFPWNAVILNFEQAAADLFAANPSLPPCGTKGRRDRIV